MRSQTGSSLVTIIATLAFIGALAAGFLPAMMHHPGNTPAAATPAPQDATGAARTAVQSIDAAQQRAATTP